MKFSIDICKNVTPSPAPIPQTIRMPGLGNTRLPFLNISSYFRLLRSIGKRKDRMYHQHKANKTLCRKSWVDFTGLRPQQEVPRMVERSARTSMSLHIAAFPFQPPLAYVN
jgi:hypothetical protein